MHGKTNQTPENGLKIYDFNITDFVNPKTDILDEN